LIWIVGGGLGGVISWDSEMGAYGLPPLWNLFGLIPCQFLYVRLCR